MPEAATLTQQHKQMQKALAARTTRDMLAVWPLWDPNDRASWERFSLAATAVIRERARQSAGLAAGYYKRLRTSEIGPAPAPDVVIADPPAYDQVGTSLIATGLVGTIRALSVGFPVQAALRTGFVRVSRAAERHVLNAGRTTLVQTSLADDAAAGWARVTEGTCGFCSELAAEGTFTKESDFAAHDGCQCSAEPQFVTTQANTTPTSWYKALTEDEFKAGEFYKGTGYKSMNPALRGQAEMSALMERRVSLLDSALEKGALGRDQTLYRMAPESVFGDLQVGSEFMDQGFISTSLKKQFAGDYRHNKLVQIFEIRAKAGQTGGYADQLWRTGKAHEFLNPNLTENEFILPRGTKFRVTRIWTGSDGLRHVAVEVVR